jgi:hypothetical protein
MLPLLVIVLVIVYFILDKAGIFEELGLVIRRQTRGQQGGHPELNEKTVSDPETDRRLEVFEDFIEGLDAPEEEE